jgi:DNA-binding LytR/AlgR family response regulator
MKVLIIEDERPATQKLRRLLADIDPEIEIVQVLESVEKAINWLTDNSFPDLIFMDIQLEDGICFEIFEKIKISIPVIFITAYNEYALKAFKVNSVDYLLKPVNRDELEKAILKYRQFHKKELDYAKVEELFTQLQPKKKERFLIKIGEHYKSIQIADILCFFIRERNCFMRIRTGRDYPVDYSLDKVEMLVDPLQFFRVNRDFIISFSSIRDVIAYSSSRLKIMLEGWSNDIEIVVSRDRVADFKNWMDR